MTDIHHILLAKQKVVPNDTLLQLLLLLLLRQLIFSDIQIKTVGMLWLQSPPF